MAYFNLNQLVVVLPIARTACEEAQKEMDDEKANTGGGRGGGWEGLGRCGEVQKGITREAGKRELKKQEQAAREEPKADRVHKLSNLSTRGCKSTLTYQVEDILLLYFTSSSLPAVTCFIQISKQKAIRIK